MPDAKDIAIDGLEIHEHDLVLTNMEGLQLMFALADHYGFELTRLEKSPENATIN